MKRVKMSNSVVNKTQCPYFPYPEGFFGGEEDLREPFLAPPEVSFELDLDDPFELFLFFFFGLGEVVGGILGYLSRFAGS